MHTIGRVDKVSFPGLNLCNINIKVDTGAYTSSIHSHDVMEVEVNGEKHLEFKLLDPSLLDYNNVVFRAKSYTEKIVKSSFGNVEHRYIIKTNILIFELSLSDRSDMNFPILLGRKFLNKRFLVNTSLTNLSFKREQKKKV